MSLDKWAPCPSLQSVHSDEFNSCSQDSLQAPLAAERRGHKRITPTGKRNSALSLHLCSCRPQRQGPNTTPLVLRNTKVFLPTTREGSGRACHMSPAPFLCHAAEVLPYMRLCRLHAAQQNGHLDAQFPQICKELGDVPRTTLVRLLWALLSNDFNGCLPRIRPHLFEATGNPAPRNPAQNIAEFVLGAGGCRDAQTS